MNHPIRNSGIKYMLAGGTVAAALGLLFEPQTLLAKIAPTKDICQEIIQPQAVLSRDRLSQLLTLPEQASRESVRQVMQSPYCRLTNQQTPEGTTTQREVYPLAFDPQTWLIVTYAGDKFAGYSFSFQR